MHQYPDGYLPASVEHRVGIRHQHISIPSQDIHWPHGLLLFTHFHWLSEVKTDGNIAQDSLEPRHIPGVAVSERDDFYGLLRLKDVVSAEEQNRGKET